MYTLVLSNCEARKSQRLVTEAKVMCLSPATGHTGKIIRCALDVGYSTFVVVSLFI